jgi:hypothetical protein
VPITARKYFRVLNWANWKCVLSKTQYCDVITKCTSKRDLHINLCCECSLNCPVVPGREQWPTCTAAPSYRTAC